MVLFLLTATGFAADEDRSKDSRETPEIGATKKSTRQESEKEKKSPEWPRPYKSTEEISVDSTVPFPTDI